MTSLDPKGLFFECLVISLFQSKKATYNYWPVDNINSQAEPEKLTVQPPADVMTFQDLKGLKEIVNEAHVREIVNKYLVDDEMDEEELTNEQIEQKTR
ncbi:5213_t:CDS:1, partial [Paraglomus occultum]